MRSHPAAGSPACRVPPTAPASPLYSLTSPATRTLPLSSSLPILLSSGPSLEVRELPRGALQHGGPPVLGKGPAANAGAIEEVVAETARFRDRSGALRLGGNERVVGSWLRTVACA